MLFLALAMLVGATTVAIDNEWVRTERVIRGPGEQTPARPRLPSVIVYLTDCDHRVTHDNGRVDRFARKAGDVGYLEAGRYSDECLSSTSTELVHVELKAPPQGTFSRISLDVVKLDPEHHPVLLDNDRVRVLRTILEPRVKSPMHEHPHYVVVYLTELHTTMKLADGRVIDNPRRPGEIAWRDALRHETEQMGERTAVEIQIELK